MSGVWDGFTKKVAVLLDFVQIRGGGYFEQIQKNSNFFRETFPMFLQSSPVVTAEGQPTQQLEAEVRSLPGRGRHLVHVPPLVSSYGHSVPNFWTGTNRWGEIKAILSRKYWNFTHHHLLLLSRECGSRLELHKMQNVLQPFRHSRDVLTCTNLTKRFITHCESAF